jgi:hypothetical protein
MNAVARYGRAALSGAVFAASLAFGAIAAASEPVDVELVLAVDTSSSMKTRELRLQRQGYAAAFRSRDVIDAILDGIHGRVAVTYVEWGASGSRRVILPWTLIGSVEDAHDVADILEMVEIKSLFQTSIAGAIRYGQRVLQDNEFKGLRRVIDISGDGPNNQGGLVTVSRDVAVREGITVNGLPLMLRGNALSEEAVSLDAYYSDCVIGGPSSFMLPVRNWDQFPAAVRRKLVLELARSPGAVAPLAPVDARIWKISGRGTDCMIGEALWRGWSLDDDDTK